MSYLAMAYPAFRSAQISGRRLCLCSYSVSCSGSSSTAAAALSTLWFNSHKPSQRSGSKNVQQLVAEELASETPSHQSSPTDPESLHVQRSLPLRRIHRQRRFSTVGRKREENSAGSRHNDSIGQWNSVCSVEQRIRTWWDLFFEVFDFLEILTNLRFFPFDSCSVRWCSGAYITRHRAYPYLRG